MQEESEEIEKIKEELSHVNGQEKIQEVEKKLDLLREKKIEETKRKVVGAGEAEEEQASEEKQEVSEKNIPTKKGPSLF